MNMLLKSFLIGLLLFTSLNAKILFDLQEQYFEHEYNQDSKAGLYKLPNVSVSTVNIHQSKDGRYVTQHGSSGMLVVRLNHAIDDFSVSIKGHYKSLAEDKTASIVLKSDDGDEFIILINQNEVIVQGKAVSHDELDKNLLHINIRRTNSIFTVSCNGKVFSNYSLVKFTKLKRIEQTINNVAGAISEDSIYDTVVSVK